MKSGEVSGIVGFLGSAFAALCCIGLSVLIGVLGAIDAGFLVQDRILIPLLIVSLTLSLVGLVAAYRLRQERSPLIIGTTGIGLTLLSVFSFWKLGVYLGLGALLAATVWNLRSGILEHRHLRDQRRKAA